MPQLTEFRIRAIKPSGKIERFYDAGGLYLETSKAGGKYWRWKYQFQGKENRLSFGKWPEVTLRQARELRDSARRLLGDGVDPRGGRACLHGSNAKAFAEIADEFVKSRHEVWSQGYAKKFGDRLKNDILPFLGDWPARAIGPKDVLGVIRKMEQRDACELAEKALGMCSSIFRYGVAIGEVESDPCRDLRGALAQRQEKPYAALTKPRDVGRLMLAIDSYSGTAVVRAALAFSALTFCRPGEVRHAEWQEMDFEQKMWTIPASKMKARREHRVPLSRQAIEVLNSVRPWGASENGYVFYGPKKGRPLSENGVNLALRNMGYTREQMTAHGFRAMASTLLNELGHDPDAIEVQLAHKGSNKIRAIYNRAQYMRKRHRIMQAWADYLDKLRALAAKEGLSGS